MFAIRRCHMVPGSAAAHDDSNSTLRVTAPIWALAIYGQSTVAAVEENSIPLWRHPQPSLET